MVFPADFDDHRDCLDVVHAAESLAEPSLSYGWASSSVRDIRARMIFMKSL